jgi:hypothetical protein
VNLCDDDSPCTEDVCIDGECAHRWLCDDHDPCTIDQCVDGVCQHTPKNCDDGDPCTVNDRCDPATGECISDPKNCDDNDACTDDSCDPQTGECLNVPKDCDDGNLCTDDCCDEQTGDCIHEARDCSDGDPCTTNERCDPDTGQCTSDPVTCDDDGDPCTSDLCDPLTGECVHPLTGCDDTTHPGRWIMVQFDNIGICPTSCEPESSDRIFDPCGNMIVETCQPTPVYNGDCAYEFWFNATRVGVCVYTCGINAFQVKSDPNNCRFLYTRHRTQDQLTAGCDQGASGFYDWQVYVFDAVAGVPAEEPYCRQGTVVGWERDEGDESNCEKPWWLR